MINRIRTDLKRIFQENPRRLKHIEGVHDTAVLLAKHYGESLEAVQIAALCHDMTKGYRAEWHIEKLQNSDDAWVLETYNEPFYHGFTAAMIAKTDYGVRSEDTLNAIRYHTHGRIGMTLREKIIFIADYIEPNRSHAQALELYPIAFKNLDEAIAQAMQYAYDFHHQRGDEIPKPAVESLNYYKGVRHD